jgi:hypothetical protein
LFYNRTNSMLRVDGKQKRPARYERDLLKPPPKGIME